MRAEKLVVKDGWGWHNLRRSGEALTLTGPSPVRCA